MKLLHAVLYVGPQQIVEVTLSRPNANVALLDDPNWWLYQRGQTYRPTSGGFFNGIVARLRPPYLAMWHLVIDLGGQPGDITASYRLLSG